MPVESYPVSKETSEYLSASIDNNKFTVGFSGAPFLSLLLFLALNETKLEFVTQISLQLAATSLFITLMYSHVRFLSLSRARAIVLSRLALEDYGELQISRPDPPLNWIPGLCLFVGCATLICGLSLAIWN